MRRTVNMQYCWRGEIETEIIEQLLQKNVQKLDILNTHNFWNYF